MSSLLLSRFEPPPDLDSACEEISRLKQVNRKLLMLLGHELGSPLTVILAYLRLWQERLVGVNEEELDLVVDQALALKERLDDLVLLDQLEAGLWCMRRERVSLKEVVETIAAKHRQDLEQKQLALVTEIACTDSALADREMLARALEELLANAIKFSPSGGTIRIVSRCKGQECQVSVSDEGTGISQEQQRQIFEPFFQVELHSARRHKGLGLGLKLVHAIVSGLGGWVTVTSRIGAGSAFTLTLPICDAAHVTLPAGVYQERLPTIA